MKPLARSRCWASLPCISLREMGAAGPLGVHLMVNFEPALRTSWLVGAVRTLKPGIWARTLVVVANARRQAFANEYCILKN